MRVLINWVNDNEGPIGSRDGLFLPCRLICSNYSASGVRFLPRQDGSQSNDQGVVGE